MTAQEIASLKSTIGALQIGYFVLFGISLAMIAYNSGTVIWALTLVSAVGVRLYRTSLVNKYNAAISNGPAPLS
jgi:hypothetical protein